MRADQPKAYWNIKFFKRIRAIIYTKLHGATRRLLTTNSNVNCYFRIIANQNELNTLKDPYSYSITPRFDYAQDDWYDSELNQEEYAKQLNMILINFNYQIIAEKPITKEACFEELNTIFHINIKLDALNANNIVILQEIVLIKEKNLLTNSNSKKCQKTFLKYSNNHVNIAKSFYQNMKKHVQKTMKDITTDQE
ncbi:20743_t:CDS:2, partial [Cetraspora pellucida]